MFSHFFWFLYLFSSVYDARSVGSAPYEGVPVSQGETEFGATDYYEPKIADQSFPKSKGSILVS